MAWFTFTRHERNGLFVLSFVLLILQSVLLYRYFIHPDLQPRPLSYAEKAAVKSLLKPGPAFHKEHPGQESNGIRAAIDPNRLTETEWIKLGLSPKQATVVINWKAKGGVYRSKKDVESMKFIPPAVYRKLESWLVFSEPEKIREKHPDKIQPRQLTDLNAADTTELCGLPLIGPGRARTIWKFRERLGGYYSLEQLKEIRSIPDSVYAVIVPRLEIRKPVFRKIDINTVSDTLYHPYFSKNLLRMMVAYRIQNGAFRNLEDLRKLPLVDEDLWRKIAPYITLSLSSDSP